MIDNYCLKNGSKLIFIAIPFYDSYLEKTIGKFDFLNKYYNMELIKFTFFDFSNYKVTDSCFQDVDHLNERGIKLFEQQIINDIKSGINFLTIK